MKIKRRELDPKTEAAIMDLTSLACGKRWAGNVRTPDESYTGRHRNNGNCYHWWPETGFAPPTITETICDDGRKVRVKTTLDDSKPAPFRMLDRVHWEVRSPKGFQPNQIVRFKYPESEDWAGDSANGAHFLLLNRWDFRDALWSRPAKAAWRVRWVGEGSTGYEFRCPEWRLTECPGNPSWARPDFELRPKEWTAQFPWTQSEFDEPSNFIVDIRNERNGCCDG
jgi:hypothetical protein